MKKLLESTEEICDLLPGDPRALFDHAQSLAKAGDWNAFEKVVEKLDAEATLTDAQLGISLPSRENKLGNLANVLKHTHTSTGHWRFIPETLHHGCAG